MSMNDNNGTAMPDIPPLTLQNPLVVMLEDLVQQAKSGQFASIAVIAIGPQGQLQPMIAGPRLGDMYLGCGIVQQTLLRSIMQPQNRSNIITPGR